MIATNSVLDNTINVTYIHYFWIIPLVIFLVAYIIAFSNIKLFDVIIFEKVTLWLLIIISIILFLPYSNYVYIILMTTLFLVSLVCNLYLIKDAPDVSNLTTFYLYISLGGALGGVFSSIISPLIFNNVYEYPIIVVFLLIILFLKYREVELFKIEKWEYFGLFIVAFYLVILNGISTKSVYMLLALFVFYAIRRLFVFRKIRSISLVMLLFIGLIISYNVNKNVIYQTRNFYGIKRVITTEYVDRNGKEDKLVNLLSGNTLHGSQFERGNINEFESLTYYDKTGSTVGRFFSDNKDVENVGVVGLGVGILSGLSTENQNWKYFEIDPQVIEIASDTRFFTMLDKYRHTVVSGDARITLQEEENNYYDVLVLDAYTGDLIPASLLTKEAVELYKNKLKPDGILFFHISNNQFELKPVLSTVAEKLGIECYIDTIESKGTLKQVTSEWVMMTNNKDLASDDWAHIEKYPDFALWTDDKYSLTSVLKK